MKTSLQDLIQWTLENAFNIEGQDGTKYVAIDHEEMRLKFDEWLEKEKQIIVTAYKTGYLESGHLDYYPDKHSKEYYDELFAYVLCAVVRFNNNKFYENVDRNIK